MGCSMGSVLCMLSSAGGVLGHWAGAWWCTPGTRSYDVVQSCTIVYNRVQLGPWISNVGQHQAQACRFQNGSRLRIPGCIPQASGLQTYTSHCPALLP